MAFGDFENTLQGNDLVTKIADYSSAWWDMLHAAQIMHARSELVQDAAHYFVRRGLLDGAIITYSRCFESGRRRADVRAGIRTLIDALDDDMKAVHETVDWWRDKHIAHRVDLELETVSVHLLWSGWKKNPPIVRTRVSTTAIPTNPPDFEQGFENLAHTLSVRIWEAFLSPLQRSCSPNSVPVQWSN